MTLVRTMCNEEKEVVVHEDDIKKICENVISVLKEGLPEEAHTIEVLDFVLKECGQSLQNKILKL